MEIGLKVNSWRLFRSILETWKNSTKRLSKKFNINYKIYQFFIMSENLEASKRIQMETQEILNRG